MINHFIYSLRSKLCKFCNPQKKLTESDNSVYKLFKKYPKYSDYFLSSKISKVTKASNYAIILQGLIETKENISLETVRLYKKMYPGVNIIVSTWDYTPNDIIVPFIEEGCHIVLSKDIDVCGTGNVNYQITTSLAGLRKAKELGATYSLKNRSDLRFFRENFLDYLKNLLDIFPVEDAHSVNLKGRIISQAGNWGQLFLPNWLQDFWFFGYTDDLINYFDIPLSNQQIHSTVKYLQGLGHCITGEDLYKENTPEMYLCGEFLNKYNKKCKSVREFWDVVKKYFIIVNQEDILSVWFKYGIRDLSSFYCEYDGEHNYPDAHKHISFQDWINIKCGTYIYEEWMEEEKKNYIVFR